VQTAVKLGLGGMDWIAAAYCRDLWPALLNEAMNLVFL
jgi:hypothetical protein